MKRHERDEMLEALKQWKVDTGCRASVIEENAFIAGWRVGRNHYMIKEHCNVINCKTPESHNSVEHFNDFLL